MTTELLDYVFVEDLNQLCSAETQFAEALPQMAESATRATLRELFDWLHESAQSHLERLEAFFGEVEIGFSATCFEMESLIQQCERSFERATTASDREAALVSAAEQVLNYLIAGYRCARSFAEEMGDHDAIRLLDRISHEEDAARRKLHRVLKTM